MWHDREQDEEIDLPKEAETYFYENTKDFLKEVEQDEVLIKEIHERVAHHFS